MWSGARKLPLLYVLASLTLITASLYWAKAVLIPVALAILLAFLLNPVVHAVQWLGVGRVPAVLLVVALGFASLGGMSWAVLQQIPRLTDDLPRYEDNIKRKIADLRGAGKGSFLEKAQTTAREITEELEKSAPASAEKPVPVVVQSPSALWQLPTLLEPLATAALVLVLVIFMLLERGDMRNRLIRLVGYGRLTLTTKALDEAGHRISRYLLMQSIINSSFGIAVGVGLFLIGLPYALLWGVLAAVLRFIPYVGPTVAALLPIALSLAVFPGWNQPLLVIGLIVLLELVANMIMEPLLYGRVAGVSEVSLMVAIAFWTWLWGPVGLLLATPLTVSLGVLGRYVPQLEFLGILLSDEPVLETHTSYYQRLVARDQDEAVELVEDTLRTHSIAEVYEAVLVPALYAAKKDQARANLTDEDMHFIVQATQEIVEDLGLRPPPNALPDTPAAATPAPDTDAPPLPKVPMMFCPAHDEADALVLLMLQHLLDPTRYDVEILPAAMLTSEVVSLVEQQGVGLICLGSLAPGGIAQTRYLCLRLRARFPDLKIVVGRWGGTGNGAESHDLLRAASADYVETTLHETGARIRQLGGIHLSTPSQAAEARVTDLEAQS
jgi:predicted PurR-regulated permease PerM